MVGLTLLKIDSCANVKKYHNCIDTTDRVMLAASDSLQRCIVVK